MTRLFLVIYKKRTRVRVMATHSFHWHKGAKLLQVHKWNMKVGIIFLNNGASASATAPHFECLDPALINSLESGDAAYVRSTTKK